MNFEQENKVLEDFIIITNLLGFIGSYKFNANLVFIVSYKNHMNFVLKLI
jgi:hypothetical protein